MANEIKTLTPIQILNHQFVCDKCGTHLNFTIIENSNYQNTLELKHKVEPCRRCIASATAPAKRLIEAVSALMPEKKSGD